jgi:hypothetical protein
MFSNCKQYGFSTRLQNKISAIFFLNRYVMVHGWVANQNAGVVMVFGWLYNNIG